MKFLSYLIESIKTDVFDVEMDEDLKDSIGISCIIMILCILNIHAVENVLNIPAEKSGAVLVIMLFVEAVIAFVIYYIKNKYKEFAVIQEENKIEYIKKISHRG